MLLTAVSEEKFQFSAVFFGHVFTIVCAISKRFQSEKDVRVAVVSRLVTVLSTQLDFLKGNVLEGGREAHFGVDPQISPIRGSRINFLQLLISDLQARFRLGEWADSQSDVAEP